MKHAAEKLMKRLNTWLAFAAGCATMGIVAALTVAVRAQGMYQNAIHVCVADEGTMRLANGSCPAGQSSMWLKKAGEEAEEAEQPDEQAAKDDERLAKLDRRIKDLESSKDAPGSGPSRVVAPFEVLDRGGRRIFGVEEGGVVSVYNGGKALAMIRATEGGGHFMGLSTSGDLQASVGAAGSRSGLIVTEGGIDRIYIGKQDSGHYGARFSASSGQYVAAIGQNRQGAGLVGVYGADGVVRAAMRTTDDGRGGHISVYNGDLAVAELTVGKTGGGLLTIGSSSGERMVAAGVQPGNFGVVQTGPASFATAAGLPLPGSYLSGKP